MTNAGGQSIELKRFGLDLAASDHDNAVKLVQTGKLKGLTMFKSKTKPANVLQEITEAPAVEIDAGALTAGTDPGLMRRRLHAALSKCIPTLEVDEHVYELAFAYKGETNYADRHRIRNELAGYVCNRIQDFAQTLRLGQAMKYTRARAFIGTQKDDPQTLGIVATASGKSRFFGKWEAETSVFFTIELGDSNP